MLIIRFIHFTATKRYHLPQTIPDEPLILAAWHGDLLMQFSIYAKMRRTPRVKLIISEHFDGQLIADTMGYFGLGSVRGSSRHGGARALIQALGMIKQGFDLAVTPDGPKGPRHTVADGVVVMAQKTGSKVIVLNCRPSRYWTVNSWDRFRIPKPFARLEFYASEPIDLAGMDLEEARRLVKMKLMEHEVEE